MKALRKAIEDTVRDSARDVAYYGRKEDEDLGADALLGAVASGLVTHDEMAAWFLDELKEWCKP